ncbi:MAG TPA: hypothetical protein VFL83_06655 [Anaeromyxobacter sp.]|nr:hypothetical protein [Anaeromyxobacter sp.]
MIARIARSCLGIVLAAAAPAAAQTPLPAGYPDLVGPRALALSASIGIAAGNEGMWVNPAAIAARRRYSLETDAFVDRRGADTTARFYGGSVVDSQSAPVAAGIAYVRGDEGAYTGNAWTGALGGSIAQGLYLGVAGKYLSFEGPRNVSAGTVDAGLFWQVAPYVSIGAAGYNLVSIANPAVAPMGYGVGVGIGDDRKFQLTADWRTDLDRAPEATSRWAVGAEVLLGDLVPVRGGWMKDETLGGSWWSVGAGLVTRAGVSLDVAYRQSLDDPGARTIAGALKVFVFQ